MARSFHRGLVVLLGVVSAVACGGQTAGGGSDAATDAKACVTIDSTTYDRSCALDSDCMIVPVGTLCTGQCGCGGTPINKKESARYQAATSSVKLEACPCASPGIPRCVSNACILCTFSNPPPGCGDAG